MARKTSKHEGPAKTCAKISLFVLGVDVAGIWLGFGTHPLVLLLSLTALVLSVRVVVVSPRTRSVTAKQVSQGMRLYQVAGERVSRGWNMRSPVVTKAEYRRKGEGGKPTVYIESADQPGWTWCLSPGQRVVVADK